MIDCLAPLETITFCGGQHLAVVLLGVAEDRLLEGGQPVGGRVADLAGVELRRAVEHGVERGLALGLAPAEVDDRLALLPQLRRGLVELQGGRGLDGPRELADAHGVLPFRWDRHAAGSRLRAGREGS